MALPVPLRQRVLEIKDDEIAELIRALSLTTFLHPLIREFSHSSKLVTSATSSSTIKYSHLMQILLPSPFSSKNAPPSSITINPDNSILTSGLQKIKQHIELLNTLWNSENEFSSLSSYTPYFKPQVTKSQLTEIMSFVDVNNSGKLDIKELDKAFKTAKRFDKAQMLLDGCRRILEQILPFMRANKMQIKDVFEMFKGSKVDQNDYEISEDKIQEVLESFELLKDDIADGVLCLNLMKAGSVKSKTIIDAFKIAAYEVRSRERKDEKIRVTEQQRDIRNAKIITIKNKREQLLFTRMELMGVFDFLDYNKSGFVNIDQVLISFSRARRSQTESKMQKRGKALLKKIHGIVVSHNISSEEWFEGMDTSFKKKMLYEETDSESDDDDEETNNNANPQMPEIELPPIVNNCLSSPILHQTKKVQKLTFMPHHKKKANDTNRPTGSLSTYELRTGLKRMAESDKNFAFTETDLLNLMRYIDPNSKGKVTFDVLECALAGIYNNDLSQGDQNNILVYDVMRRIDDVAKTNDLILVKVFRQLDVEDSGELDKNKFVDGLKAMKRVERRHHTATISNDDDPNKHKSNPVQESISRFDQTKHSQQHADLVALERSGAGEVLRCVIVWIKQRGLTISSLLKDLSKNGNGSVVLLDDFVAGVQTFLGPSPRVQARASIKAKKEAMRVKEDGRKVLEAHRLKTQISYAEECGAVTALHSLEHFMRKNGMRVVDLFKTLDANGNGDLDAHELRKALKKIGLTLSKPDVRGLVSFLDISHDGYVDRVELDAAVTNYRRYQWAKEEIDGLLSKVKTIPLVERYSCVSEVFGLLGKGRAAVIDNANVSGQQVADALMRMRGDNDARLWLTKEAAVVAAGEGSGGAVMAMSGSGSGSGGQMKTGAVENNNSTRKGLLPITGPPITKTQAKAKRLNPLNETQPQRLTRLAITSKRSNPPKYVKRLYNLSQQSSLSFLFNEDNNDYNKIFGAFDKYR